MKNYETSVSKEAQQLEPQELQVVRKHKLSEITIRNNTFFYKNRKKGFDWQQKKSTYKNVQTNIYVPNILDDESIAILEKFSRIPLDLGSSLLKISLTVNVPQVITVKEVPDEFGPFCNKENFYLLCDGRDIRRQFEDIPCLLLKRDFELYDRHKFQEYCSQVNDYENPAATYKTWSYPGPF